MRESYNMKIRSTLNKLLDADPNTLTNDEKEAISYMKRRNEILEVFAGKMLETKDIPAEYVNIVNKNLWELI